MSPRSRSCTVVAVQRHANHRPPVPCSRALPLPTGRGSGGRSEVLLGGRWLLAQRLLAAPRCSSSGRRAPAQQPVGPLLGKAPSASTGNTARTAAGLRPFVPVHVQPAQPVGIRCSVPIVAFLVGVFDAQDERPPWMAGEQPAEQAVRTPPMCSGPVGRKAHANGYVLPVTMVFSVLLPQMGGL